jgi:RNA polymerase-binding protein DksA
VFKREKKPEKLTEADIKKFQELLLEKRADVLNSVNCMEEQSLKKTKSDLSNLPVHMADIGSDDFEVQNTIGLMDGERKILIEIDDAIRRIRDGTYGICEGSGEPIKKERLEAIPWTRYCVDCARLAEKGGAGRETLFTELPYGGEAGDERDEDLGDSAQQQGD